MLLKFILNHSHKGLFFYPDRTNGTNVYKSTDHWHHRNGNLITGQFVAHHSIRYYPNQTPYNYLKSECSQCVTETREDGCVLDVYISSLL